MPVSGVPHFIVIHADGAQRDPGPSPNLAYLSRLLKNYESCLRSWSISGNDLFGQRGKSWQISVALENSDDWTSLLLPEGLDGDFVTWVCDKDSFLFNKSLFRYVTDRCQRLLGWPCLEVLSTPLPGQDDENWDGHLWLLGIEQPGENRKTQPVEDVKLVVMSAIFEGCDDQFALLIPQEYGLGVESFIGSWLWVKALCVIHVQSVQTG
eukprot:5070981-Amphidinium_carterae.1